MKNVDSTMDAYQKFCRDNRLMDRYQVIEASLTYNQHNKLDQLRLGNTYVDYFKAIPKVTRDKKILNEVSLLIPLFEERSRLWQLHQEALVNLNSNENVIFVDFKARRLA